MSGLADRLLTPDRLSALLREAIRHRRTQSSDTAARRVALRKELKDIEAQIDRLYTAIAEGTITDTALLRSKLGQLNARRDECLALEAGLGSEQPDLRQALSKQQAASVAANLKRRLLDAPHELRKRYVHGLVSEIVVGRDKAVISGPSAAIAAAVSAPERLAVVRTFVREWRSAQSGSHFAPASRQTPEQSLPD